MAGCGFVAVGEQKQENTFFAEGRSAVAGILTPVFSDRHRDQKKKKKRKRSKKKRKNYYFYYIYKRYLKDYYIYNSCLCPFCCPCTCPCIAAGCRFYRSLTCPRTCPFCCPYPCPYPAAGCRFYRSLTCPCAWGCCLGMLPGQ